MASLKSDRRLYLDAAKEIVCEEGDERASYLLAPEGGEISADDVARYGLHHEGGKVTYPAAGVKMRAKPEDKMVPTPENKAAAEEAEPADADEPVEEEWPLKTSPEAYLEKKPDGPKADLARRVLGLD